MQMPLGIRARGLRGNLAQELLQTRIPSCFPHYLFFVIRTGSASEKIQSGTSQEAEGIKVLAQ